jgi:endothelin-converting enzyme/putative endopeptidase
LGSFNELQKTDKDALDILKEASKNPMYKSTTDQGKAINLFNSILDTVARDKQDIAPLRPYLAKLIRSKH